MILQYCIACVVNPLHVVMLQIRVWLSMLMQLYDRLTMKPETKSYNKTLFVDIIPVLLRVWLEPLPPTVVMQELKEFQKHFKNCTDNQQLLCISQMMSFNLTTEEQACDIHVHRSIEASSFLKSWQEDISMSSSPRKTGKRYHRYVDQLTLLLRQLSMDRMCDLIIVMMQISQCSITKKMNTIYGIIAHYIPYEKHLLIWEYHLPMVPPAERAILIAEMNKSSCPITRQVMVLHLQLERQMILYLQQLREQLNQRIEMQLELEKLIQYERISLQEQ